MPRLIDDLRAPGAILQMPWFIRRGYEADWKREAKQARELLYQCGDAPVILIDNVAEYYAKSDQERWDERDFPNLAPPYQAFWMEHRLMTRFHSKEMGDTDITAKVPKGRLGVLMIALAPDECKGTGIPPEARWLYFMLLFVDFDKRGVTAQGPYGSMFLAVDDAGRALGTPHMQCTAIVPGVEDVLSTVLTFLQPAFLAISFLHCKNVAVEENTVPKPLAKKYQARTGIRPTAYKTLVIEPLKQVLRREGRSAEVGIKHAMHICRGHFKDYRDGRGLFGKHKILVWHDAVVRGTKSGEEAPPRTMEVKV